VQPVLLPVCNEAKYFQLDAGVHFKSGTGRITFARKANPGTAQAT